MAIEEDGFAIDAKVDLQLSGDTPACVARSMGYGLIGFADVIERLRPDIVVVLGDRFEILPVAQAALVAGVPVAHIHGGEVTEGAFDDAIRHALTKLSHLHFVAAPEYARRVLQMGEAPERVFDSGRPDWIACCACRCWKGRNSSEISAWRWHPACSS